MIALVSKKPFPGEVKPEITESMLEISTSVQRAYEPLRAELLAMRDTLVAGADRLDLEVAGGGAHPFQRWQDRQIYDRPRFRHVAGLYGYLAKQFTVFGAFGAITFMILSGLLLARFMSKKQVAH